MNGYSLPAIRGVRSISALGSASALAISRAIEVTDKLRNRPPGVYAISDGRAFTKVDSFPGPGEYAIRGGMITVGGNETVTIVGVHKS